MFEWGDKTAKHLAAQTAKDDYERSIVETARKLVDRGDSHYLYGTQYSSGSCLWHPGTYEKGGEIIRLD